MKLFLFSLSLILLTACASAPPKRSAIGDALWQVQQPRLSQIEQFQLNGRLAVKTNEDNWTANVYWKQHTPNYELRFTAPMGQGALRLDGTAQGVILRTAEQKTYYADNPDELMREVLKLALPVSYLYYWVRGIPVPHVEIQDYLPSDNGYLYSLMQADWKVQFDRYQTVQNMQLPGRIWLENEQFSARFVISEWQLETLPLSNSALKVKLEMPLLN
jgi:outer membrane lipoprotein LolB